MDKTEMLEMLRKAIEDGSIDVKVIPVAAEPDEELINILKSGQVPTVDNLIDIVNQIEKYDPRKNSAEIAEGMRRFIIDLKEDPEELVSSYIKMKDVLKQFASAYKPTEEEKQEFKDLFELAVYLSPQSKRKELQEMFEVSIATCPSKELWDKGIETLNDFIDRSTKAFQSSAIN